MNRKTILCAIAALTVIAFAVLYATLTEGPPSYWSFSRHRSARYYAQFADACDRLIAQTVQGTTNVVRLQGDDPQLPEMIRKLTGKFVEVRADRVYVFVNAFARYGVEWKNDESSPKLWKLTVIGEAEPVTAFARTN